MNAASDKQMALISKLRGERVETESVTEKLSYIEMMGGRMTTGQASQLIDALLAAPRLNVPVLTVGCQVRTPKFGVGTVTAIDGVRVTVDTARGPKVIYGPMLKTI